MKDHLNTTHDEFRNTLQASFFTSGQDKYITISEKPPVNIVRVKGEGIINASREYFDLLQYFED